MKFKAAALFFFLYHGSAVYATSWAHPSAILSSVQAETRSDSLFLRLSFHQGIPERWQVAFDSLSRRVVVRLVNAELADSVPAPHWTHLTAIPDGASRQISLSFSSARPLSYRRVIQPGEIALIFHDQRSPPAQSRAVWIWSSVILLSLCAALILSR